MCSSCDCPGIQLARRIQRFLDAHHQRREFHGLTRIPPLDEDIWMRRNEGFVLELAHKIAKSNPPSNLGRSSNASDNARCRADGKPKICAFRRSRFTEFRPQSLLIKSLIERCIPEFVTIARDDCVRTNCGDQNPPLLPCAPHLQADLSE